MSLGYWATREVLERQKLAEVAGYNSKGAGVSVEGVSERQRDVCVRERGSVHIPMVCKNRIVFVASVAPATTP